MMIWRNVYARHISQARFTNLLTRRMLVMGWNDQMQRINDAIQSNPKDYPYRITGVVSDAQSELSPATIPVVGSIEEIETLLESQNYDVVMLADIDCQPKNIIQLANACEQNLIDFKVLPTYFEVLASGLEIEQFEGLPILGIGQLPLDRFGNQLIKRAIDILGSIIGLILAIPVTLIFGILIYLESPEKIIYSQIRTGANGIDFRMLKLRSMKPDVESSTGPIWAKKEDPRCLRIGTFMRKYNIDEVPQFWNVLKGEMSLVGASTRETRTNPAISKYYPSLPVRHRAKPGMTGWSQINGLRGNTDLKERIRYDIYYLENWSIWLDIYIMIKTFLVYDNAA